MNIVSFIVLLNFCVFHGGCSAPEGADNLIHNKPGVSKDIGPNITDRFFHAISQLPVSSYPFSQVEELIQDIEESNRSLDAACRPDGESLAKPEFIPPAECNLQLYTLSPAPLNPASEGRRVAIMDHDMFYTGMTRYPSRIIGVYKQDPVTGMIFEDKTYIQEMPKGMVDSLSSIDSFPVHLPAKFLHSLAVNNLLRNFVSPVKGRNGFKLQDVDQIHGNPILVKIMDLVPDSQAVLIQTPYEYGVSYQNFCNINHSRGMKDAQAYLDAQFLSLVQIIKEKKVNFVNQSYAITKEGISYNWEKLCEGRLSSRSVKEFYQIVTDHNRRMADIDPNVVFFKGSSGGPFIENMGDCIRHPNFIKVNPVNTYGNENIPIEGSSNIWSFPSASTRDECTDIFIALDRRNPWNLGDYAIDYDNWGLEANELGFEYAGDSSSFAAPIAIAYYITIKELAEKFYRKKLTPQEILSLGTSGGKIVAPARHNLLPFCREYSGVCKLESPFWKQDL